MKKRKRQVPRHPDFESLGSCLGPTKEPETFEDELVEYIDGTLMFDGFPGFEEGAFIVSRILKEHKVDLHSPQGEKVLQAYIDHALSEFYGDFYRFSDCTRCGENFRPDYTTGFIKDILNCNIRCSNCESDRDG